MATAATPSSSSFDAIIIIIIICSGGGGGSSSCADVTYPRDTRALPPPLTADIARVSRTPMHHAPYPFHCSCHTDSIFFDRCCKHRLQALPVANLSSSLSSSHASTMAGRGRGRTLPAWMTDDAAPGSAPAPSPTLSTPLSQASSASSPPTPSSSSSNVTVAPPPQRQAPPGMMPGDYVDDAICDGYYVVLYEFCV